MNNRLVSVDANTHLKKKNYRLVRLKIYHFTDTLYHLVRLKVYHFTDTLYHLVRLKIYHFTDTLYRWRVWRSIISGIHCTCLRCSRLVSCYYTDTLYMLALKFSYTLYDYGILLIHWLKLISFLRQRPWFYVTRVITYFRFLLFFFLFFFKVSVDASKRCCLRSDLVISGVQMQAVKTCTCTPWWIIDDYVARVPTEPINPSHHSAVFGTSAYRLIPNKWLVSRNM